jgi:sulfur carrier protein
MKVLLNGQGRDVPDGCTLDELLAREADVVRDAIATAVNGEFVARTARATCALKDGDAVTCFQPITGG